MDEKLIRRYSRELHNFAQGLPEAEDDEVLKNMMLNLFDSTRRMLEAEGIRYPERMSTDGELSSENDDSADQKAGGADREANSSDRKTSAADRKTDSVDQKSAADKKTDGADRKSSAGKKASGSVPKKSGRAASKTSGRASGAGRSEKELSVQKSEFLPMAECEKISAWMGMLAEWAYDCRESLNEMSRLAAVRDGLQDKLKDTLTPESFAELRRSISSVEMVLQKTDILLGMCVRAIQSGDDDIIRLDI